MNDQISSTWFSTSHCRLFQQKEPKPNKQKSCVIVSVCTNKVLLDIYVLNKPSNESHFSSPHHIHCDIYILMVLECVNLPFLSNIFLVVLLLADARPMRITIRRDKVIQRKPLHLPNRKINDTKKSWFAAFSSALMCGAIVFGKEEEDTKIRRHPAT